jgi:signal transduction histidine kinase
MTAIASCAVCSALAHKGRARAATTLFLTVSAVLVAGISVARGPHYPASIPLYLMLVLLAGMLSSTRAAIVLAAFAVVASTTVTIGHDLAWFPPSQPISAAYRALSGAAVIVVVAIIAIAALRRMKSAQQMLAQTVEERTAHLVIAREAAEAASRTKTAFLANMSHELRTPMNAMLGSISLLLSSKLDGAQVDLVRTVKEGGDALLAILNDVLDLAAVEAGRLAIEHRPFHPHEVTADVVRLLEPEARRSGLALTIDVDDGARAPVFGDERRVRQVLLNLIGNAVKFTDRGHVGVRVRVLDGLVRFDVEDTGKGIRTDDQDRMFHPFTQIDSSSTRTRGGIGLGLSISRELAHALGGDVTVKSELGQGSTFTFAFPHRPAPALPRTATPAPAPLPSTLSILVAEDNEVNARVLIAMLAQLGLHADVVGTGAAALAAARRVAYDVILMDVHMPEMDGLEATRRIRAETGKRARIVAVTADALPEEHKALFAGGFDAVLTKPVFLEALAGALAAAA